MCSCARDATWCLADVGSPGHGEVTLPIGRQQTMSHPPLEPGKLASACPILPCYTGNTYVVLGDTSSREAEMPRQRHLSENAIEDTRQ